MSRPLRIEYPGAWYHAMNRGRRREKIFLNKKDHETFLILLKEASELWTVNIAAYSLMPNHYHILIHTPKGNLSRFMRHVNGIYTQLFNINNGFEGQLFRGRYKSILIEGNSYLLQLLRYIHRNPVRARLISHMDDFEWSSHLGYISMAKKWNWLYKDFMFSFFSENKKKQLATYREFMARDDDQEVVKIIDGKKWPVFWGSDSFVQSMKEKYFKKGSDREISGFKYLSPDADHIKSVVCRYYSMPFSVLIQKKRRSYNEPRDVAVYLSRWLRNDTLGHLSRDFLLNSHSSASNILRKVRGRLEKDAEFKKKVGEIEELCLKSQVQTWIMPEKSSTDLTPCACVVTPCVDPLRDDPTH